MIDEKRLILSVNPVPKKPTKPCTKCGYQGYINLYINT